MKNNNEAWSLEEKVCTPDVGTPCHTDPINKVFAGFYEFRVEDIYESKDHFYHLSGKITVSKVKETQEMKKNLFGKTKLKTVKRREWQSKLHARGCNHQLYHPLNLAERFVEDLKTKGICINSERAKELFVTALRPYVNQAILYCEVTKRCEQLGFNDNPNSDLLLNLESK